MNIRELIRQLEAQARIHGEDLLVCAPITNSTHYTTRIEVSVTNLPHDLSVTIEGV